MYTVYGIYEVGKPMPLYIGMTMLPLCVRWSTHRSQSLAHYVDREKHAHIGPTALLKGYWIFKHTAGIVQLEIRPILETADSTEAVATESELIEVIKPLLNDRMKNTKRRQGMAVYARGIMHRRQHSKAA